MKKAPRKNLVAARTLSLPLTLACLIWPSALPAFALSNGTEWKVEQDNVDLGKLDLYISHDAVRIVSKRWGYQLLARAPEWTVHCFRPEEKTEWISPLKTFCGEKLFNPTARGLPIVEPLNALTSGQLGGLRFTKYAKSRQSFTSIFASDDMQVAPEAAEFVSRFYEFPSTGKIPLYRYRDRGVSKTIPKQKNPWISMNYGGDLRSGYDRELSTKSWIKLPFNSADFAYPQGYARRSSIQVAMSATHKQAITDFLSTIGFACEEAGFDSSKAARSSGGDFEDLPVEYR